MVFKSDKQRKKVMALLRGNTKSEVNPQVVGRITERDEFIVQDLINLQRKTGITESFFDELDRKDKKILIKLLEKRTDLKAISFGGDDFTQEKALAFADDVRSLKSKGFKKIGIQILSDDNGHVVETDIYAKTK